MRLINLVFGIAAFSLTATAASMGYSYVSARYSDGDATVLSARNFQISHAENEKWLMTKDGRDFAVLTRTNEVAGGFTYSISEPLASNIPKGTKFTIHPAGTVPEVLICSECVGVQGTLPFTWARS